MKLGVALPIVDTGGEPAALREFAQAAEAIGCHSIAAPTTCSAPMSQAGPDGRSRARSTDLTIRSCCSAFSPAAPPSGIFRRRC